MMNKKQKTREAFRQAVFKRDGFKCVYCGRKNHLDAHHITDRNLMPNGGYVLENGITVCPEHHYMLELYHQGKEGPKPDEIYPLIDSSLEKAIAASEKLK